MLVKGNGPEYVLALGRADVEAIFCAGTFGTTVSVGHTTLGERNCTFSVDVVRDVLDIWVSPVIWDKLASAFEVELLFSSETKDIF